MLSQLVKSQGKGQGGTKSFVPLKTVPDEASQPAQRTHLENLWSVNVATTRYQPKLVKLVDEGSVILSFIYACTHTGVQTKCGYCTAYIHFVWSFHLGQFSLPTSGWPLVLQFSLLTSGWPLVLQFSLPTSGWPLVLQVSLPTSGWPLVLQFSLPTSGWPLVLQFSLPTSGWPLVLQFSLPTSGWPLVLQFSLPTCGWPLVLQFSLPTCGWPLVLQFSLPTCGWPLVLQFSLPTSGWPLVLQVSLPTSGWPLVLQFSLPTSGWPLVLQFSLLPRCSHLLHPPHTSSCKTLLLWTSHSSCGRPNFLAFFCAYFVCCQDASSSGRSLLDQFSGGTYCDKSVQSIHTCHHYWPSASGLLCAQRSMPDVLISCLHCRSLSCLDTQWIIAFVFPKDGDRPLVQEIWAGLGVVCLWPRVK